MLTALFAAATTTVSLGAGIAAALPDKASAVPDVVGQTYADAKQTIGTAGLNPVIATRVGGRADEDQCIVTNAWFHTTVTQRYEKPEYDEVMLALNCAAAVATPGSPGNSAASPEGREALRSQAQ